LFARSIRDLLWFRRDYSRANLNLTIPDPARRCRRASRRLIMPGALDTKTLHSSLFQRPTSMTAYRAASRLCDITGLATLRPQRESRLLHAVHLRALQPSIGWARRPSRHPPRRSQQTSNAPCGIQKASPTMPLASRAYRQQVQPQSGSIQQAVQSVILNCISFNCGIVG